MPTESEPLESYYAADTLGGLIRSCFTLLVTRRVRPASRSALGRLRLANIPDYVIFVILIVIPAILLSLYQWLRRCITGRPAGHTDGAWQYYVQTGLREDAAHHTNETVGYHQHRPAAAADGDDLTAWAMAVMQLLWNYDELMGQVWDEWTVLRLVGEAAGRANVTHGDHFHRLQRKWELARPYHAPLNGTYADARRATFEAFITPRWEALPQEYREAVDAEYTRLAQTERPAYQKQMSLLATLNPQRHIDQRREVRLLDLAVGVIVNGRYYLLDAVDRDGAGRAIVYGPGGQRWPLTARNGRFTSPQGEDLIVERDAVRRAADGELVGYLSLATPARTKWQVLELLEDARQHEKRTPDETDRLLTEAPRKAQRRLRRLLPAATRASLDELARAPVIINWDVQHPDRSLAELRRTRRGVGDHALTLMRTTQSFIFDQSHIFFDGTWSLAIAEVLTNSAIQWCERCLTLTPIPAAPAQRLDLASSPAFLSKARRLQGPAEIAAETVIWDISSVFALRELLAETGTSLTVNDLLVITRIFHAAHYRPTEGLQEQLDVLGDPSAAAVVSRSLRRGRILNPALLIPVDASPTDPRERIFPITFRNLADNLVRVWDDTWEAYQSYRRIEPPDTAEGAAAFHDFALKRTLLVSNLRAFSHILAANKAVAMRGHSLNITILNLLGGLPLWLQTLLKEIPEQVPPLNEMLRGDEVYSNVGRVARGASLSRFMTAKDDGNTKALAWGVMTDDEGRLIVTMRDFRPHVQPLLRAGREDLVRALAQDYVSSYTGDLIGLVSRLSAMLQAESPQRAKHMVQSCQRLPAKSR